MLLCAITDRQRLPSAAGTAVEAEAARRRQLRALLADWIEGGVDFVQLREKDLDPAALSRSPERFSPGSPAGNRRSSSIFLLLLLPPTQTGLLRCFRLCDGIHLPGTPVAEDAKLVRQAFRRHGRDASLACPAIAWRRSVLARRAGADLSSMLRSLRNMLIARAAPVPLAALRGAWRKGSPRLAVPAKRPGKYLSSL